MMSKLRKVQRRMILIQKRQRKFEIRTVEGENRADAQLQLFVRVSISYSPVHIYLNLESVEVCEEINMFYLDRNHMGSFQIHGRNPPLQLKVLLGLSEFLKLNWPWDSFPHLIQHQTIFCLVSHSLRVN